MTPSTQHRNTVRSAVASAQSAEPSDDCGTRQGTCKRDRQSQNDDLERIAVNMGRGLKPVSDASHYAVDQLEICKSIAKAFERGKRFYKRLVLHASPPDFSFLIVGDHSTSARNRTADFRPKIRKSIPQRPTSEQFYASPEHPCIHQDQRSDDERGENEHETREHHVILCNTACFAMWGSYTLGVSA